MRDGSSNKQLEAPLSSQPDFQETHRSKYEAARTLIRRGRRPQAFGSVGSGSLGGCSRVVTHPLFGWEVFLVGLQFRCFFWGGGGEGGRTKWSQLDSGSVVTNDHYVRYPSISAYTSNMTRKVLAACLRSIKARPLLNLCKHCKGSSVHD